MGLVAAKPSSGSPFEMHGNSVGAAETTSDTGQLYVKYAFLVSSAEPLEFAFARKANPPELTSENDIINWTITPGAS